MPDKNKLEVFKKTNMILFKGCVLCKHGEIPANTTWGYCKHPNHFYDHSRHGRLPGASHAAMGCDDFVMKSVTHRDMIELGPYLKLVPLHDAKIKEVGVEEVDVETKFRAMLNDLLKQNVSKDGVWQLVGESEDKRIVEIRFKGSPKTEEKKTDNGGSMHFNGEPVYDTPAEEKAAQSSKKSTKKASKQSSKKKTSSQPETTDKEVSSKNLAYDTVTTVTTQSESALRENSHQ